MLMVITTITMVVIIVDTDTDGGSHRRTPVSFSYFRSRVAVELPKLKMYKAVDFKLFVL